MQVKEVFNRARENKPSIVLLDELDSIASKRGIKGNEASKVVNQLLTEMDGIRSLKEVVVIGTTNRFSSIDKALIRPGRFDKVVYMPLPKLEERAEIFEKYLGTENCKRVDCRKLAELTEGYSGADISAVTREAKIRVLKARIRGEADRSLSLQDLEEALRKVKPSVKRRESKGG